MATVIPALCRLQCCLFLCFYATVVYTFTEPTQCSSDCSFINRNGELRECHVKQMSLNTLTSQRCSDELPDKFFAQEEDIPMRLGKNDVKGYFSQSSLKDPLKIKIDVTISEQSHNRINGLYLEVIDSKADTLHCFLLDFNGTLKLNDIIPTYSTGGDRVFSFFPCIPASKAAKYSVVAFPLPLLNQPTDTPKKNYQYRFDWLTWQIETCITNSIMYLDDSQLTIGFGRLELKINSSSLFNYNCPLSFTIDNDLGEKEDVFFDNGIALRSDVQSGLYELKFFLDGTLGANTYIKKKIKKDYSMKGRCLSFPCEATAVCNQHKNEHYCSCQPGQVLKEETNCFIDDPCHVAPCGDGGTCKRIETKSSINHTCTCYRGFYAAYNTCMVDPCYSNPCANGQCLTIESDSNTGLEYTCQCSTGFYHVHNTCKNDPCNGAPCGDGGTCKRIKTKSSIYHTCTCDRGYYAAYNTCMVDPCYSNPCVNGQCLTIESDSNTDLDYTCQCSTGFYHVHNTCKTDPCYQNPCDNGTCIVLVKSSSVIDYSCTCYLGFYLVNETCQYDYCYDNVCYPGSDCVNNNNGYTCQCLSSYIPQNGKCVRNEDNNVLEVIIGITGALIGVVLILIVLVAKHCYGTSTPKPVKSHFSSESEDTQNITFFGDMLESLRSFYSSSSQSDNGTQHERKTARMDSSTVDYPLLDHQKCQANDSDVYYYGMRPNSASSCDAHSDRTSSSQLYSVQIANADPEAQFKQDVVERESSL